LYKLYGVSIITACCLKTLHAVVKSGDHFISDIIPHSDDNSDCATVI